MIIAHLPAGYLLSKSLQPIIGTRAWLWAGLLGSIFPDFDLVYWYFFDQGTFHRQFWTHLPLFWLGISTISFALCILTKSRRAFIGYGFFISGVALHLFLDTLIAPVYWLYPFSPQGTQLLTLNLSNHYDFWMWNYIMAPIMLLEFSICAIAATVWMMHNQRFLRFSWCYARQSLRGVEGRRKNKTILASIPE